MPNLGERLRKGWNAFRNNKDPTPETVNWNVASSGFRPDRTRLTMGNERSIITAIYNRIALDVSAISLSHVRLNENKRYLEEISSPLNNVLQLDANTDQTARAFFQDVVLSMFDEGSVAIIPVDVDGDPIMSESYDIYTVRTGQILEWYPQYVKVRAYDERDGKKHDVTLPKHMVAIIENPFYAVMNDRNSILKRLVWKLNLLDAIDEQSSSGKLDLIIQLPYVVRGQTKEAQAEKRRKDIEEQLTGSKYGIAYIDGTEHITQLNRAVENNLMGQIEYLTTMLYSQMGITEAIMNGSAKEEEMLNYNNRTVEPIVAAIVDEMNRKFLSKNARSRGQAIQYHRDPFRLVPVNSIADIADKFTRNEILSSNEVRCLIGFNPSDDPQADELRNKNLNQAKGQESAEAEDLSGTEIPQNDRESGQSGNSTEMYTADEVQAMLNDLAKRLSS